MQSKNVKLLQEHNLSKTTNTHLFSLQNAYRHTPTRTNVTPTRSRCIREQMQKAEYDLNQTLPLYKNVERYHNNPHKSHPE